MLNLDKLAYNNLKQLLTLDENDKIKFNGSCLTVIKDIDENNEGAVSIKDVDLILYFTYNQILLKLEENYCKIKDKKNIILSIERSLNNIYNNIGVDGDINDKIFDILYQVEDQLSNMKYKYITSIWYKYYCIRDNILSPVYDIIDDITDKYIIYKNLYNHIFYKNNLEILNEILNKENDSYPETESESESETEPILETKLEKSDKSDIDSNVNDEIVIDKDEYNKTAWWFNRFFY